MKNCYPHLYIISPQATLGDCIALHSWFWQQSYVPVRRCCYYMHMWNLWHFNAIFFRKIQNKHNILFCSINLFSIDLPWLFIHLLYKKKNVLNVTSLKQTKKTLFFFWLALIGVPVPFLCSDITAAKCKANNLHEDTNRKFCFCVRPS